jgi:predicted nucleic acid-binding protein
MVFELLETAVNIPKRYDVTVYDAIYIALAKLTGRVKTREVY